MARRGPTKPHPGARPPEDRPKPRAATPAPPPAPSGPIWARGPRLPVPLDPLERVGVVLLALGGIPAFASIPDGYSWLAHHAGVAGALGVVPLVGIGLLERRRLPTTRRALVRGLVFGILPAALVAALQLLALPLVSLVAGIRAYYSGAGWVTPAALVAGGATLIVASMGDREFVEGVAPSDSASAVAYITVVAFTWAAAAILFAFRPRPAAPGR